MKDEHPPVNQNRAEGSGYILPAHAGKKRAVSGSYL
jgi:hypothetical protein